MEDQILQLLKEIKEGQIRLEQGQKEIKEHIKNLDTKIDDIQRDIVSIELITSKNWIDVIQLKQNKRAWDESKDLTEIKNYIKELKGIVKVNCFDIAELKTNS